MFFLSDDVHPAHTRLERHEGLGLIRALRRRGTRRYALIEISKRAVGNCGLMAPRRRI